MGNYLEKLSDRSYVVKTNSENQILRRNRDFLKQAENPATFSKPGEVTESQPSNHGNSVYTDNITRTKAIACVTACSRCQKNTNWSNKATL